MRSEPPASAPICVCDRMGIEALGPGIPVSAYPALRATCEAHGPYSQLFAAASVPHVFGKHRRDNQCEMCGLGEAQHSVTGVGQARLL